MFANEVQAAIRFTTMLFGVAVFVLCVVNFSHSGFILSAPILLAVHTLAFYTCLGVGHISSNIVNDWSTLLRLHSAATTLVLTIYVVTCRLRNGKSYK